MKQIQIKNVHSELRFGLIFVLLATIVTLLLGEITIRVISSVHLIYNIEMVKYAKYLKMRDPTGQVSHVHRPLSSFKLMGVDISLNSLGNRAQELKNPKQLNCKRVLVLGSSVTMGWGVPFEKIFTTVTESQLNVEKPFGDDISFEFINAGIGNYNTKFQFNLFQRQYPIIRPDIVILHYFISDVQPRSMGRDSFILRNSFLAAFLFDRWSQVKLKFNNQYKDLFTFYSDLYMEDSLPWEQTQEIISAMRDITKKDNVPFLIMIIPDIHDLSFDSPYQLLYKKIEKVFLDLDIPTINTFDEFQHKFRNDVSKLWVQSDDPHPNAMGHQLMADILYRYLVTLDPLKLKKAS